MFPPANYLSGCSTVQSSLNTEEPEHTNCPFAGRLAILYFKHHIPDAPYAPKFVNSNKVRRCRTAQCWLSEEYPAQVRECLTVE